MIKAANDSICPVCGNRENTILYDKNEEWDTGRFFYRILKCNSCSHLFSFPSPAFKESDTIYEESRAVFLNDLERTNKKIKRLKSFWRRFVLREYLGYKKAPSRRILKYLCALFLSRFTSLNLLPFHKEGRILDVGCNNGLYLHLLKNLGWQVWGVEIDRNACKLAKELNINIFCGNLEEAGFSESFFDVVRLNQVLEHIPDPKKTIKEARRILKKDGKIYISIPNARSFAFFLFGDAWLSTGHVQGFSPCSMKCFCGDLGLKIKSMRFSSSKNLLIMGVNYFFKARGKDISLKNGFILRIAAAGFSFILNILHLSDTLTVEAEKRSTR
ncbi:MAG: class I SAM-dependent methyltransferase [Candidatus Omnitrophica bacterium]|nr:class I SAM-dependent methyltransferase [Candidatus Omnitrophota bacterium]